MSLVSRRLDVSVSASGESYLTCSNPVVTSLTMVTPMGGVGKPLAQSPDKEIAFLRTNVIVLIVLINHCMMSLSSKEP